MHCLSICSTKSYWTLTMWRLLFQVLAYSHEENVQDLFFQGIYKRREKRKKKTSMWGDFRPWLEWWRKKEVDMKSWGAVTALDRELRDDPSGKWLSVRLKRRSGARIGKQHIFSMGPAGKTALRWEPGYCILVPERRQFWGQWLESEMRRGERGG